MALIQHTSEARKEENLLRSRRQAILDDSSTQALLDMSPVELDAYIDNATSFVEVRKLLRQLALLVLAK